MFLFFQWKSMKIRGKANEKLGKNEWKKTTLDGINVDNFVKPTLKDETEISNSIVLEISSPPGTATAFVRLDSLSTATENVRA